MSDESVITNYPTIEECEEYVRTGFEDKTLTECDKHVIGSVWAHIEGALADKDWRHKILEVKIPDHWKDEGVEEPNEIARRNAMFICLVIEIKFNLYADRFSGTKENGIYFVYSKDEISLIFEVYNDGEIGCIITDDDKETILRNEDIKDYNVDEIVKFYLKEIV